MQIFDKEPSEILWDIFKELSYSVPVYKENMTSNVMPESYIILRTDVSNVTRLHGDGKVVVRISDCDVVLVSRGELSDLHEQNIKRIKHVLTNNDIYYTAINLGFNGAEIQYSFSLEVPYYG